MIVEIIQANLTPCNQFGMLRKRRHLLIVRLSSYAGFVRVQTGAGENPVVFLSKFQRAIICAWTSTAADGEDALKSRGLSALEHLGSIRIEFVAFNVGVRIDVHMLTMPSSQQSRQVPYHVRCNNWHKAS